MTKNAVSKGWVFTGEAPSGDYESSNRDGDVTLTINGTGFGSAPNILLWAKGTDGDEGVEVLESYPEIGAFGGLNFARPKYYSLDGSTGISGSQGGIISTENEKCSFILSFPPCTEYFARYSTGVNAAAGRTTSGAAAPYAKPTDSVRKCLWFFSGAPDSPTEPDLVIGTWTGAAFYIGGNQAETYLYLGSDMDFDKWYSIGCYQKAGVDPVVDNGVTIASLSTHAAGTYVATETDKPTFPNIGTPAYDHLTFQGWKGNGSQDLTLDLYRYLYIATGVNAGSRVELGESALYSNCNEPVVAPHATWTETTYISLPIDSKMRKGKTHWFQFVDGIQVDSGLIGDNT